MLCLKKLMMLVPSVILCYGCVNIALAIPFATISQVYFFGDSLTDSGYNDYFATPSGKAPTFTTYEGYTWAQYVARDIKNFALPSPKQYPVSYPNLAHDVFTNNTTPPTTALCPSAACPVSGLLKGVNYAAGGSSTYSVGLGTIWAPSLHEQVSQFLKTNPSIDPDAVLFIWSGANDLLSVFSTSATSPLFQLLLIQAVDSAAKNIAQEVALLSEHGAKRVVVMNMPNIAHTPLMTDLVAVKLAPPSSPADMKTAVFTFNSMLNQELGKVIAKKPIKILYIDVYHLLDKIILATKEGKPYEIGGEFFYFTNYDSPVCGYAAPLTVGYLPSYVSAIMCTMSSNGYIFADDVHPTGKAHRVLSIAVEQELIRWI